MVLSTEHWEDGEINSFPLYTRERLREVGGTKAVHPIVAELTSLPSVHCPVAKTSGYICSHSLLPVIRVT